MIRLQRFYPPEIVTPIALVLLAVALIFGGASRIDVMAPIIPRVFGLAIIAWLVWTALPATLATDRLARIIWVALLALGVFQLVPLPWHVWTALPGRDLPRDVHEALALSPWHGISLTPDRTLNAFFALMPALAAWLLGRRLDDQGSARLLKLVAIAAAFSALLGLMQRSAGPDSALYFYRYTNSDSSVGLFSNANHHALFLCSGIVCTCFWIAGRLRRARRLLAGESILAALAILLMLFSILASNSRAGVLLAPLALLAGLAMLPFGILGIGPKTRRIFAVAFVAVGAGAVTLILSGALGDFGLSDSLDETAHGRLANVPIFARIAADQFPFGSGLGSFDPVFRGYERVETLGASYLNNAHNDYAQIIIETGLFGIVLLLIFAFWLVRAAIPVWRNGLRQRVSDRVAWTSLIIIGLLLAHSLVDYPLRTAALSALFGFCCALLNPPLARGRRLN